MNLKFFSQAQLLPSFDPFLGCCSFVNTNDVEIRNFSHQIEFYNKDIDRIYFTGDIIDHTIWNTSIESNSAIITKTYNLLQETFPNIPLYPVIGNHEATPLNVYPPPYITERDLSANWLYSLLARLWETWLPKDALETVRKHGYYTTKINDKLRIIGLHNNICYIYNWWLFYDTDFLKGPLIWLTNTLQEAEQNGELVHIITHIPPGNAQCIEPWDRTYNNLVSRFTHIIKGQFFGHTHTDQLKVFYDVDSGEPINVGINGASLTPFAKYNPNYKVYTVDASTHEVLEADTYIFNLTEANLYPDRSPRWYKLYSLKQDYNLQRIDGPNLANLIQRFRTNDSLLYQYYRYYVRDGDPSLEDGCDDSCKDSLLEEISATHLSLKCAIRKAAKEIMNNEEVKL